MKLGNILKAVLAAVEVYQANKDEIKPIVKAVTKKKKKSKKPSTE